MTIRWYPLGTMQNVYYKLLFWNEVFKRVKYLIPNMAFTVYKRVIYLKTTYKLTKVVDILTYGINI